jgi:hypothetical protein
VAGVVVIVAHDAAGSLGGGGESQGESPVWDVRRGGDVCYVKGAYLAILTSLYEFKLS